MHKIAKYEGQLRAVQMHEAIADVKRSIGIKASAVHGAHKPIGQSAAT
jgi:hypothetical protein